MQQLRSVLLGLWHGLDVLRKSLHLLFLLMIFAFVIGALRGSSPVIPGRAALLIAPEGEIVEQLSGDPLQRAVEEARGDRHTETLLWDLIDSIRAAATDRRIPVIAIDVDRLDSAGQPMLEEISHALKEFKATSGKKVIAYGTELSQARYYLAAQADEVYLDPMGFILIEGYDRYQWYYKQALEKLGIDVNVFRVGQYKSAVEPFIRNDMSNEDKEASLAYLKAEWAAYQDAVTRARKLPPDALAKYVASISKAMTAARGDAAQVALQAGLITGIKTRIEFERRIIDLVGEDDAGSFKSVPTSDYARVARLNTRAASSGKPRVGVIVASGEVADGDQPPGTIGGESTSRLIRQARLDRNVRAVVLRVNSPGGSVQASEEIYRELVALREAHKPLIVSMSNLAASGGYYISAPADEIWASPATITGSIGIFAIVPTIDRTLSKIGVNVDGVGTTPLSGELRLDRPLGEASRALLQAQIDRGYDVFLTRVSTGRKKTTEEVDKIAHGRVWAGQAAHDIGLVDHLGSFNDAVKAAARRANLKDYSVDFVEPELSWVQELLQQWRASAAGALLKADSNTLALARVARTFDPLRREMERLSRFATGDHIYSYCFCNVQ